MREIKFRAWDTQRKEMKKPSPNMLIESYSGIPFWQFGYDPVEPMNWIVMQFTGLKDKNGKEIYEGDITRGTFRTEFGSIEAETIAAVEWKDEKACFVCVINGDWFFLGKHLEVIGNVWENPELLKV